MLIVKYVQVYTFFFLSYSYRCTSAILFYHWLSSSVYFSLKNYIFSLFTPAVFLSLWLSSFGRLIALTQKIVSGRY